jgi:hypothetical protein
MKTLNTKLAKSKLALSVLGVALLASPAFAQRPHRQVSHHEMQFQGPTYDVVQPGQLPVYPNGANRTGSAASVESGAEFNQNY